jgi:hypothetical protein
MADDRGGDLHHRSDVLCFEKGLELRAIDGAVFVPYALHVPSPVDGQEV